jgi:hypothetical protein
MQFKDLTDPTHEQPISLNDTKSLLIEERLPGFFPRYRHNLVLSMT